MVDDWIAHTPRAILTQNFGVNESVFDTVLKIDPYILMPPSVQQTTPLMNLVSMETDLTSSKTLRQQAFPSAVAVVT